MPQTTTYQRLHRRIEGDMHAAMATVLALAEDKPEDTNPKVRLDPFTAYEQTETGDWTETGRGYDVTVAWTTETEESE